MFWGSVLAGLGLMIFIYARIDDILLPFLGAPFFILVPYITVVILIHVLHVWRWGVILKTMGYELPFRKLLSYWIMGYSLNYITPTAHIGGEPLKASMLKENDVPYTEGVSSLLIDKSFEVTADGFLGILGIIIVAISFALPKDTLHYLLILSVFCIFILSQVFFKFLKKGNPALLVYNSLGLKKIKYFKRFEARIKKIGNNISMFFIKSRRAFFYSISISIVMWFLMFAEYKLLLLMLGFNAGIIQLFIILSFVGLAYFIPVPAALGVLEAGQLSAFSILKLGPNMGAATSLVVRAKDTLIMLTGFFLISLKGIRMRKTIKETERL